MGRKSKANFNRDYLYQAYWQQVKTVEEIAKENNCSRATVSHYLRHFNVPKRDSRGRPVPVTAKITWGEHKEQQADVGKGEGEKTIQPSPETEEKASS